MHARLRHWIARTAARPTCSGTLKAIRRRACHQRYRDLRHAHPGIRWEERLRVLADARHRRGRRERRMSDLTEGWRPDLPIEEYLAIPAMSSSGLQQFRRSPAHYHWSRANPVAETDAMRFGTAVHTAILEPGLFDATYVTMGHRLRRHAEEWKGLRVLAKGGPHRRARGRVRFLLQPARPAPQRRVGPYLPLSAWRSRAHQGHRSRRPGPPLGHRAAEGWRRHGGAHGRLPGQHGRMVQDPPRPPADRQRSVRGPEDLPGRELPVLAHDRRSRIPSPGGTLPPRAGEARHPLRG